MYSNIKGTVEKSFKIRNKNILTEDINSINGDVLLSDTIKIKNTHWHSLNNNYVNIVDLGADSSGMNDSTEIIQEAIDIYDIIYIPKGIFKIKKIILKSNKKIFGANGSVLQWEQSNDINQTYAMFEQDNDLTNIFIDNLEFKGNSNYQNTVVTSHVGGCIKLINGSVSNLYINNCYFTNFGEISNINGFAIIMSNDLNNKFIDNINITYCTFKDIYNVPGIYINAKNDKTNASNIHIHNNIFINQIHTKQNCIYVLGDTNTDINNINVIGNTFLISNILDTCIEINYCNGCNISNNYIKTSNDGIIGTCILIRSGSKNVFIKNNNIYNNAIQNSAAIAIICFDINDILNSIIISENIVDGWTNCCYAIDTGSNNIIFKNNLAKSNNTIGTVGLRITNGNNILIKDNIFINQYYGIDISNNGLLLDNVLLESNIFDHCGDGEYSIISTWNASSYIKNFICRNNIIRNVVSGTYSFITFISTTTEGNILSNNIIPVGMVANNPSYLSWASIT